MHKNIKETIVLTLNVKPCISNRDVEVRRFHIEICGEKEKKISEATTDGEKKGSSFCRAEHLKRAHMARKVYRGKPVPRAVEWTTARVGRRPASPTLEQAKKRGKRKETEAVSEKMTTQEERRWGAVLQAWTLGTACVAARKRCPREELEKIAGSNGDKVRALNRLVRRDLSTGSLGGKVGSGRRQSIPSSELRQWFTETSRKHGNVWTLRGMGGEMRKRWPGFGSAASVLRVAKRLGFKRVRVRTLPLLTDKGKNKRAEWARMQLGKEGGPLGGDKTVLVHADEKWFYGLRQRQYFLVGPGETTLTVNILSRSHVNKEMILGAVARRLPQQGFNGKVGLYPVVEPYQAKNKSKYHQAGEVYERPTTMTAKLFRKMVIEKVLPDALMRTGGWAEENIIQVDNAGGHGGGQGQQQGDDAPEAAGGGGGAQRGAEGPLPGAGISSCHRVCCTVAQLPGLQRPGPRCMEQPPVCRREAAGGKDTG